MSQRADPGLIGPAPAAPTARDVTEVTAQLAKALTKERLAPELICQLGELCAHWAALAADIPRETTAERDAPIVKLRAAAVALRDAIGALHPEDRVTLAVWMRPEDQAAPVQSLDESDFLVRLIASADRHLAPGPQSRSRKSRRPPAHHAEHLVGLIAVHAAAFGIPMSGGSPFVDIVQGCLAAANIQRPDGSFLDAVPLVKRVLAHDRRRGGTRVAARAALALMRTSLKR